MNDRTTVFAHHGSPARDAAWNAFRTELIRIDFGDGTDLAQNETGSSWQYVNSKHVNDSEIEHTFYHRCHPIHDKPQTIRVMTEILGLDTVNTPSASADSPLRANVMGWKATAGANIWTRSCR